MNGCNFIISGLASRRRSSSVTRSNNSQPTSADNSGRRASSSNDLAAPANPLANKSASGNHLAAGMSSETICDQTTTNPRASNKHGGYLKHSDINIMQPTDIQLDVPVIFSASHPPSLAEINRISMDNTRMDDECRLRLEEECRTLERDVQIWEDKVDELERERFKKTASRSLVEKLVKQRRIIRELDFQLFKLNLEAEDSDYLSRKLSPLSDNENHIESCQPASRLPSPHFINHKDLEASGISKLGSNLVAGRYGSQIRPGQENTADILDAIPPSGPLQHRQYLTKASSGTDHSDYSRLRQVNRHAHLLPKRNSRQPVHEPAANESRAYVQNETNRFSPVRPNHFKGEFLSNNVIVSEDSSSPSSGDNRQ